MKSRRQKRNPKKPISAKKWLGQHFLQSGEVVEKMLEKAGDLAGKNVLEIGPGKGILTERILAARADLTAVEKDEEMIPILSKKFDQKKGFHLLQKDFLDFDLDAYFEQKKYSIIANIPYNISKPIVKKVLAGAKNRPEFCLFLVQKEVAEKICERKKRSVLSISVEIFAESEYLFSVGPEHFWPPPKVDSAVIFLRTRPKFLVDSDRQSEFFDLISAAFVEKRKKLKTILKKICGGKYQKALQKIDPDLRPENLEIADWVRVLQS